MNILFICDEYPPGRHGGIGTITRSLARGMVSAGHRVFVAGLYTPGYGQKDYEEDRGVRVWRMRMGWGAGLIGSRDLFKDRILMNVYRRSGLMRWEAGRSWKKFIDFIHQLINEHAIDIVEWPDYNDIFKYLGASVEWPLLPAPLVIKFHGTDSYFRWQMGEQIDPRMRGLEQKHIQRADVLVAVSQDTADHNRTFYRIDRETPIGVLYNSIELLPLPSVSRSIKPVIVFTGSLTPKKGIHTLLRAWNTVHDRHPEAILRVFGKGNPTLFESLLNPSSRSSVRFEGFTSRETLYQVLGEAVAAIFPSFAECFALAPLEAMAMGCPVIYTRRSSGPELIRAGFDGLLVDPGDASQIAESITTLLENEILRGQLSQNGRKTVEERFDLHRSVADHLTIYQRLIQVGKKVGAGAK